MLALTLALAAAVSPLTVAVATNDGALVAVHVADADAEPVEVCAADVVDGRAGPATCAPVVVEGERLLARLDRPSSSTMRVSIKSTRQAWRGVTNAVVATGLAGVSAVCFGTAIALSVGAGAVGGGDVSAAVDVGGVNGATAGALNTAATVMVVGGAVAAVSAAAVGFFAVIDAGVVE